MFDRFRETFAARHDALEAAAIWADPRLEGVDGYGTFAQEFAGASFGGGLYRVHDSVTGPQALSLVTALSRSSLSVFVRSVTTGSGESLQSTRGGLWMGNLKSCCLSPERARRWRSRSTSRPFMTKNSSITQTPRLPRTSSPPGRGPAPTERHCCGVSALATRCRCSSVATTPLRTLRSATSRSIGRSLVSFERK